MKFIDTNVLVYLADKHDVDKRETAKTVVADAMRKPEEYLLSPTFHVQTSLRLFSRG